MLALYRCGRQAEALNAYRDVRGMLVEHFGVEPRARAATTAWAILRQDVELEPPAAEALGPAPELDARTPSANRDAELEWLPGHWRHETGGAGRLVLLTSVRGISKAR